MSFLAFIDFFLSLNLFFKISFRKVTGRRIHGNIQKERNQGFRKFISIYELIFYSLGQFYEKQV